MNINVANCYNTYIKVLNTNSVVYLYVYIHDYKNSTNIEIDTRNLTKQLTYKILLFNGKVWKRIGVDGKINTSIYKFIAVNYQLQHYDIHYEFYDEQNNLIFQDDYSVVPSSNQMITQLQQKICFPQLIYTNQPLLSWNHSIDLDQDDITYELQLYLEDRYELTLYPNINKDIPIYYVADIEKNNEERQTYKITQQIQQQNNFYIRDNCIFKWRTRAKDSFGQYSQWSDFSYFKKLNILEQSLYIIKRIFQNNKLFQFIHIDHNNPDLYFKTMIINRINSELYQSLHIDSKDALLYFKIFVTAQKRKVSTLTQFIHIKQYISDLTMQLMASIRTHSILSQYIHVTYDKNNLLNFTCYVPLLLKQQLYVRAYTQLEQELQIFYASVPLQQQIDIQHTFSSNDLIQQILIRIPHIKQLKIEIYDSDNHKVIVDNRINIYDENGEIIDAYDINGKYIYTYPYVQDYPNIPIQIYDEDGALIQNIYDENGNQITVYSSENIIPNYVSVGQYTARYTVYDIPNSYYRYNINTNDNSTLNNTTIATQLQFNVNYTATWKILVNIYQNDTKLMQFPTEQLLYVNINPNAVIRPFYINGSFMDNTNVIYHAIPTFSFNPIVNNEDNDLIGYNIQISKNNDFTDLVLDNYLFAQSTDMIHYTIPQEKYLFDQGYYYFRIGTCDYATNGRIKSIVYSQMFMFRFYHIYSELQQRVTIANQDYIGIQFRLPIRGASYLYHTLNIKDFFESEPIYQILTMYKQRINISDQEMLNQNINIRCISDLVLPNILITKNYSDITQSIIMQYDYYHFPITQQYIQNGELKQRILMDVPPQHYLYFKCMTYLYDTSKLPQEQQEQFTIRFKADLYSRYYTDKDSDIYQSIIIMNRISNSKQDLFMKCRIWNMDNLPYWSDIYNTVAISNWCIELRHLYQTVTFYYAAPPSVVITANIPQKTWQSNYRAVYTISLSEQSKLPIAYYSYVIDRYENTIPAPSKENRLYGTNTLIANLKTLDTRETGKFYLHVRSVNDKGIYSTYTTTYCIYYNNRVEAPIPLMVNGQDITGNQCPVIRYNNNIILTWMTVYDPDFDVVSYDIQVSSNVQFTQINFSMNNIPSDLDTSFYSIPAKTLAPNKYYWRVRSFDGNQYSNWSIRAMFYINKAPEAPTRLSVTN